jgi:hypothetical protein
VSMLAYDSGLPSSPPTVYCGGPTEPQALSDDGRIMATKRTRPRETRSLSSSSVVKLSSLAIYFS